MFAEINPAFLTASLFFLSSAYYLYLCIVTLTNNTKSELRDSYLSAGFCLVLSSLFYGLMIIAVNETLIRIFWACGFTSICLFFSRWLLFSSDLVVLKHKNTKRIIKISSISTILICILCVLSNDTVFVMTKYGIQFSYQNSLFFICAIIYLIIIVISLFVLDFRWWRESELKRSRMQALLFIILTALIAPIGFAADFIIPAITKNTAIPLASLCFLPVSMPFFISMRKYKTLSITVPNASGYVFNTVTVPTLVLDHKNIIRLENKAACNFLGSSVIGKSISKIILYDGKIPGQSFFQNDFSNKKVIVGTPAGVSICDMLLAIENDRYNDALCKVVLLRDITENVYKDKMLQTALEQANAASIAKSYFLSNMSHEIRTPMNAVIGMTAIGKSSNTIEKKNYALNKIGEASKHLLGIINDILDMSKIEADKLELSNAGFEFEKMLHKVVDIINYRVDERRQKLYINIGKDIPQTFIGDDLRLSQVLTNLLGNAIKFTPDGGTIRLNSEIISKENDFYRLQISVEDTGIGVTDEQKTRLFQAFEQAENDTSRKFGGTGLGLAISKRIVELMGGKIWVESEPGKGTKFIFTILLKQDTQEEMSLPDEKENWKNIRIFVVDDEPEILKFFTALSENYGLACTCAANNEDALKTLDENDEYDIYFLDWGLQYTNGKLTPDSESRDPFRIELVQKIQATAVQKPIVITFSSIDWHLIEDEARTTGIDNFLSKPLFPSDVIGMINKCLGIGSTTGPDNKFEDTGDFSGYSILIVDDVDINREIMLNLLEPTHLNVDCAENGAQALNFFISAPEKYDLIFMDIQMPEMDGYEATRRIRAFEAERDKQIPIIAMTANVFHEDINKCLETGMNGHVGKPIDFTEVISQLRKYLH